MNKQQLYMLDTNTVSYIIKGQFPKISQRLRLVNISDVCISAITEAELLTGLAKKPDAINLHKVVHEFLIRVDILAWDSRVAKIYADFRCQCEKMGRTLGSMDMLIAAHSIAVNAKLISNDKAFYQVSHLLDLEDWS
jgi:tRNA(fMet)-specific endonuclease VapC